MTRCHLSFFTCWSNVKQIILQLPPGNYMFQIFQRRCLQSIYYIKECAFVVLLMCVQINYFFTCHSSERPSHNYIQGTNTWYQCAGTWFPLSPFPPTPEHDATPPRCQIHGTKKSIPLLHCRIEFYVEARPIPRTVHRTISCPLPPIQSAPLCSADRPP